MIFSALTVTTDYGAFLKKHANPFLVRALEVTLGGVVVERVLDKVVMHKDIRAVRFIFESNLQGGRAGFYCFVHWMQDAVNRVGYVVFSSKMFNKGAFTQGAEFVLESETECLRFWEILRKIEAVGVGGLRIDTLKKYSVGKPLMSPLTVLIFKMKGAMREWGLSVLLASKMLTIKGEFDRNTGLGFNNGVNDRYYFYIYSAYDDSVLWGAESVARKDAAIVQYNLLKG